MDRTTSVAQRRMGAVALLAFVALLLLGVAHNSAAADPVVPVATPTVRPEQPVPQPQTPPFGRRGDHDGGGFRPGGGGFGGGGIPGGGTAPAQSTDGTTT